MVAIQLPSENMKDMAARLRQFMATGGNSIKQTHAYEALAKTFGYRDWNTLAAQIEFGGANAEDAPQADGEDKRRPKMILAIDRHAMAAHGVKLRHVEVALRREFPELLGKEARYDTLTYEQFPLRELPKFSPPVISISWSSLKPKPSHEALTDCIQSVAMPKWFFGRPHKLTVMFFPEQEVDSLLVAIKEAVRSLPAEVLPLTVEKDVISADHPELGEWRSNGVSYFVWEWDLSAGLMPKQLQLANLALKFNGESLIRLRDVATLHGWVMKAQKQELDAKS